MLCQKIQVFEFVNEMLVLVLVQRKQVLFENLLTLVLVFILLDENYL
jgi:hypothetical protein